MGSQGVTNAAKIRRLGIELKKELLSLARDLDKHEENVSTAKVVGTTTSALAGGLLVGATIMTGGLALPAMVVLGGLGAGTAGAATAVGAEVVGKFIKRDRIDRAQKKWDDFCSEINGGADKLDISKKEALSEMMMVFQGGGGIAALAAGLGKNTLALGKNTGSVLPVIGGFILVVNVIDLVGMAASDKENQPGAVLRKFVNTILSEYVDKHIQEATS